MLSDNNRFLEEAYRALNGAYFGGALPDAVITIQSSRRTYGHITAGKPWRDNGGRYHEINISAEHLDRPVENITATLLHEMCHLYAMEEGIKDTSNGGRYHNKRFKEIAEKRDLRISHDRYIGWSITEPTERLMGFIKEKGLSECFEYVRDGGMDPEGVEGGRGKPVKTSTRKYVCPGCGNSVRATKDVNIGCLDCGLPMEKAVQ